MQKLQPYTRSELLYRQDQLFGHDVNYLDSQSTPPNFIHYIIICHRLKGVAKVAKNLMDSYNKV